jgi:glycosyltransferase involved in cell wall biosynthesis
VRESIVDGVNGLLLDNDPRAMAAAVARLSREPEYARRLGQRARQQVVEQWSLEAAVERLEQRLRAAFEDRRRAI